MRSWSLVLLLALTGCSGAKVTYLSCVVGSEADDPWRFKLDEGQGTFELKTNDLPSLNGKADFMAEEITLHGPSGRPLFVINRQTLAWGKWGDPPGGRCEQSQAPDQQV